MAFTMLMDVHKTLGKVETLLERLSADVTELKAKANRVDKILFASYVIGILVIGVGGWMIAIATSVGKEILLLNYKASLEAHPAESTAPPTSPSAVPARPALPKPPSSPRP